MIPWNPTHRHKVSGMEMMAVLFRRKSNGEPTYFVLTEYGGTDVICPSELPRYFEPLPSAQAEMPEPLVVFGEVAAYCWIGNMDGRRMISIAEWDWQSVESRFLTEWLARAIAWQKGAS
jgi:hypothetical protein